MKKKKQHQRKKKRSPHWKYKAAFADLEKMKDGGMLHDFAVHMSKAPSCELAHGIRPTSWEKISLRVSDSLHWDAAHPVRPSYQIGVLIAGNPVRARDVK